MALVAEDAALDRGPHGVLTGLEQIRAVVELEMQEGLKAKVSQFQVSGDTVIYYYEVFLGGSMIDSGWAQAVVRDGKIVSDLPAP